MSTLQRRRYVPWYVGPAEPDLDALHLYRAGCRPTPYAREILSAVRAERARLADGRSEP